MFCEKSEAKHTHRDKITLTRNIIVSVLKYAQSQHSQSNHEHRNAVVFVTSLDAIIAQTIYALLQKKSAVSQMTDLLAGTHIICIHTFFFVLVSLLFTF